MNLQFVFLTSHIKIMSKDNFYSEETEFREDCPNYPFIPTVLPKKRRIIAIGDIHGDLELAIRSLKLAGVIDDKYNWIAQPPDTVIVQVGDQVDSCRPIAGTYDCRSEKQPGDLQEDIKVMEFFNKIDKKARKKGGAIYSLLGNHELMNAEGNFNYVSYENYHNFDYGKYKGPSGRRKAFRPGGPIAKMMACTRPSVIVIGSNLFAHAGVLPALEKKLGNYQDPKDKLKYLNAVVRKWLLKKLSQDDNSSILINNLQYSPFWTRIYGSIPEHTSLDSKECFKSVHSALEVYQIGHIIIGHTPQMFAHGDGINGTCYTSDGKNHLFRVDGGFSRAFQVFGNNNHFVQILEIIDDDNFNILTSEKPNT